MPESQDAQNKRLQFRSTPPFKLKDKNNRGFQVINLKNQFGFTPEVIVIEKVPGQTNLLVVRAIVPQTMNPTDGKEEAYGKSKP